MAAAASLLGRANELLPRDGARAGRAAAEARRALVSRGERRRRAGAARRGERRRRRARRRAARGAGEARDRRCTLLWTRRAVPPEQVLARSSDAVPVLEQAGDYEGLAMAEVLRFHALDRARLPDPERRLPTRARVRPPGERAPPRAPRDGLDLHHAAPRHRARRRGDRTRDGDPRRLHVGVRARVRARRARPALARCRASSTRRGRSSRRLGAMLDELGLRQAAAAHSIAIARGGVDGGRRRGRRADPEGRLRGGHRARRRALRDERRVAPRSRAGAAGATTTRRSPSRGSRSGPSRAACGSTSGGGSCSRSSRRTAATPSACARARRRGAGADGGRRRRAACTPTRCSSRRRRCARPGLDDEAAAARRRGGRDRGAARLRRRAPARAHAADSSSSVGAARIDGLSVPQTASTSPKRRTRRSSRAPRRRRAARRRRAGRAARSRSEIVLQTRLDAAEQPVGRHRDPVAVDDRVGRGDRERGRQDARRSGRRRSARRGRAAQPSHVQSSSTSTPRTGKRRRTSGDRNEPSSRQAPKAATSRPTCAARQALAACRGRRPRAASPGPMKFASPKRSAHVRRNGWPQRKRNALARAATRSGERSGSRSSWNGVRMASSETVENAYETASTRNGSARASPKSAPPSGGPASCTAACRPVCAPAARRQLPRRHDGAQRAGVRGREEGRAGCPRRRRRAAIAQKTMPVERRSPRRGCRPRARGRRRRAIISHLRFQRSAASPAGRANSAARTACARTTTKPALAAEPVSASTSSG